MNIFALSGHKVTCTAERIGWGLEGDKKQAEHYLKAGNIYTVSHTKVSSSSTTVYLDEIEGVGFNSVHFVDVNEQPQSDDAKHEAYRQWMG